MERAGEDLLLPVGPAPAQPLVLHRDGLEHTGRRSSSVRAKAPVLWATGHTRATCIMFVSQGLWRCGKRADPQALFWGPYISDFNSDTHFEPSRAWHTRCSMRLCFQVGFTFQEALPGCPAPRLSWARPLRGLPRDPHALH